MGLLRGVFHPDFVKHHAPIITSAALTRIEIVRVLGRGDWNPETGITGDNLLPIYLGRAYLSAENAPSRRESLKDTVDAQPYKVQLPFDGNEIAWPSTDFTFASNDRVRVLTNDDDPMMEGVELYVHGWLGSTQSWARNLFCRANMKQV
jgi:hypothetical protein